MKSLLQIIMLCSISLGAWANEEATLDKVNLETDVKSVERGADAMINNCHACHSMKYVHYRDLLTYGMDKQKVEGWRGDQPLDSAVMAQMAETDAIASFGKAPPDLSLMVKAREGGANYLYSYLLGYYITKEGVPGNHFYPETKMPDVLNVSSIAEGASHSEVQAQARDIVSFLAWVADPHAQERLHLGRYVILYLLILTVLLYFVKKQVWAGLK